MTGYDFRATAQWNRQFNRIHLLNAFVGTEVNSVDRKASYFNGWGLQYNTGMLPYYVYEFFKKGIEENSRYFSVSNTYSRTAAFFANAAYAYDRRYVINGTLRYEGTNGLGKSRQARWLPTWNISGAWNISEEDFSSTLQQYHISHLTIRTSYSLTGDRVPSWFANTTPIFMNYGPWRPTVEDQEGAMRLVSLGNDNLTYEKKHEFNIGADVGLFDNRLNVSTDVFWRNNFDLIGPINTKGAGGEIMKFANVAEMKSSGAEFTISSRNYATSNFSWTTDFIFAFNQTEITKLASDRRVIDLITGSGFGKEGSPARALFSIPFVGLNNEGMPVFTNERGERDIMGPYFQETRNLDFLKYEGPIDPIYSGSLGNIVRYGNFRLNVFVTYSFGNKIRLDPIFSARYTDFLAMPREFKNRWMMAGDEHHTNIPTILHTRQAGTAASYGYNSYNYSTVHTADGGFIRLKEVSLTYDLPSNLTDVVNLRTASVRLQATNLLLLYADKRLNGQDPEFFRSGGVAAPVPKPMTLRGRIGF
jgi:hypothetical protein